MLDHQPPGVPHGGGQRDGQAGQQEPQAPALLGDQADPTEHGKARTEQAVGASARVRSYAQTDEECMILPMSDLRTWLLGLPGRAIHVGDPMGPRTGSLTLALRARTQRSRP